MSSMDSLKRRSVSLNGPSSASSSLLTAPISSIRDAASPPVFLIRPISPESLFFCSLSRSQRARVSRRCRSAASTASQSMSPPLAARRSRTPSGSSRKILTSIIQHPLQWQDVLR